jgi:hypothetical protein
VRTIRVLLPALVMFVATASLVDAKKKDDAPVVDRAAIHAALKKVGMMPMRVPYVVPDRAAVAHRFEAATAQRLRAAGFEVVDADVMRGIQARLATAMGGLYDPLTGEASREKLEARAKFARSEYLAAHPVDGFVHLSIVQRDANSYSMTASWDGVEERVTGQSAFASIMSRAAAGFGDGVVPALSFALVLEDRDGEVLYGRYGGLQLLAYMRNGFAPKYHNVDPAHLLTDTARDTRALALVFDPLTGEQSGAQKMKIALAPAALADDRGALRVPREQLLADHKRVALAALHIDDIGQRDAVRARYAELLRTRLAAAGFEVVREADFDTAWREAERAAGGLYDPATGLRDDARFRATRAAVLRGLRERHGVTAVVVPSIVLRDANYQYGVLKWDGAEQVASGSGGKFAARFGAGGRYIGRMPALSLAVHIDSTDDAVLFEDYGGIHALSRFEHGRFVDLPESQLFSEPARDEAAVDLALAEISGRPPGPRGK